MYLKRSRNRLIFRVLLPNVFHAHVCHYHAFMQQPVAWGHCADCAAFTCARPTSKHLIDATIKVNHTVKEVLDVIMKENKTHENPLLNHFAFTATQ